MEPKIDSSSEESASFGKAGLRQTRQDNDDDAVRSALHFAVGRICQEEESGQDDCARMTSEGIAALTEFVYQYTTTSLANDLVSFCRHANRRTISVDDVKLISRKDPDGLQSSLENFCESRGLGSSSGVRASGKRTSGKKAQKGGMRHRTLLEVFEKNAKTSSASMGAEARYPGDRHEEGNRKNLEVAFSSEDSSKKSGNDTETSFKEDKKSSQSEMSFGSDSNISQVPTKKKSGQQIDMLTRRSESSSSESDDLPIMSRQRLRLKGKQRTEKTIDLTED